MSLGAADFSYAAALIDSFGRLTVRDVRGTELPEVVIQGKIAALPWLAELTGTKVIPIVKDYKRHQCTEHCPDAHMRIESTTHRWAVTGARATIVLHNIETHMRVQGILARNLVQMGQKIGYKTNVVNDMVRLGWAIPDLRAQPRASTRRREA